MEIIIKKNDAFRVLQDITRGVVHNLETRIIGRLKNERLMYGDTEDCGKSLADIAQSNGMTIQEMVKLLFPSVGHPDEIPFIADNIIFIAEGSNDPCPECGCELKRETQSADGYEWTDTQCSNFDCDFADTNEPDWDTMTGGHSFDQ